MSTNPANPDHPSPSHDSADLALHPASTKSTVPDPSSDEILTAILDAGCQLPRAAETLNIPLPKLLRLLKNPDLREALADLRSATDDLLAIRTAQARITAIDILEKNARSADDPIEQRRSATALARATTLRTTSRPSVPGAATPTATDDPSAPPSPARPRRTPTSQDAPEHILTAIRAAIKDPDQPDEGSIYPTLRACMAPDATINGAPIPSDPDDFVDAIDDTDLPAAFNFRFWNPRPPENDAPEDPDIHNFAFSLSTGYGRWVQVNGILRRLPPPHPLPGAPPGEPRGKRAWFITQLDTACQ